MTITLSTPDVHRLDEVVEALRQWQDDAGPLQLHPGDIGWFRRFGAAATAAAVRVWSGAEGILAVGLLDGPNVLRLTTAPGVRGDVEVARRLAADIEQDVLPTGTANVEAPTGAAIAEVLAEQGWTPTEPWSPLRRDLTAPVEDAGRHIEVVGPQRAGVWTDVLRASFDGSSATVERWHAMAAGTPYADARSLVAYDDGTAVAVATVWSAGPGRPGLLEPVGVHPDHRHRGHGRAISRAAAAVLRELGSSSAEVCTTSSNVAAVATYGSAGFRRLPERLDLTR